MFKYLVLVMSAVRALICTFATAPPRADPGHR